MTLIDPPGIRDTDKNNDPMWRGLPYSAEGKMPITLSEIASEPKNQEIICKRKRVSSPDSPEEFAQLNPDHKRRTQHDY